jgi:hypothetical protein
MFISTNGIDFQRINDSKTDEKFNPIVCVLRIDPEDISQFIKSKISEKDKDLYKNDTFYPISIIQNRDLSFELSFAILK